MGSTLRLEIIQRGKNAMSYRCVSSDGRLILATRCAPTEAGMAGALERIKRYAREDGYRVVDVATGVVLVEPARAAQGKAR